MLECELKSNTIDIALICETWFKQGHGNDIVAIDGYSVFRHDRGKRKGGGVCIYVRSDYNASVVSVCANGIVNSNLVEIIWIKFSLYVKNSVVDYFVGCCYFPPKPIYDVSTITSFITLQLDEIFKSNRDNIVILGGDFNHLDTSFIETGLGLKQIVTQATHGKNILDKIFVNRPDMFEATTHKSLIKTKHSSIIVSSPDESNSVPSPVITKRKKNFTL